MVKQITIISGKGGTGKTTITSSFAALADNAVIADCDVDAADMHLILQPDTFETHDFYGLKLAHINKDLCTGCDTCVLNCRFDAILESHIVDPYRCEGCGVCEYVCPETAIVMKEKKQVSTIVLTHVLVRSFMRSSGSGKKQAVNSYQM